MALAFVQLILKLHLSGVAIAYEKGSKRVTPSLLPKLEARPNGSLYNRQKRKIADATEWLRLHQRKGQRAMIFCLTSPGYTSLANTPKFISRFVDNMKTNYSMKDYVWVREYTQVGNPHFHFIAHWNEPQWFFNCSQCGMPMKEKECTGCYCKLSRINQISLYWSRQFGSDSINSIRLGSYHPKTKQRTYYVTHPKQCHYLTKYIGKNIGEDFYQIDAESNCIIQPIFKTRARAFGMSEDVAMFSEPQLFDSQAFQTSERTVMTASGKMVTIPIMETTFISESGQVNRDVLKAYRWKWTGHGQTFIGFKHSKRKSLQTDSPDFRKGALSPIHSRHKTG